MRSASALGRAGIPARRVGSAADPGVCSIAGLPNVEALPTSDGAPMLVSDARLVLTPREQTPAGMARSEIELPPDIVESVDFVINKS